MRPNSLFKTLFGAALLIILAGCGGASTSGGTGGDGGGDGGGGGGGSVTTSVTLDWDAPTTNTDGSLITDLQGYKVYYGTSTGDYSLSVDVGTSTDCLISSLTEGATYYFVVVAYDSLGNESDPSNEISKTI